MESPLGFLTDDNVYIYELQRKRNTFKVSIGL